MTHNTNSLQSYTRKWTLRFIIAFGLIAIFSFSGIGQTVKQDAHGNYFAVKNEHTDSIKVIETGKFYTDLNGVKYPVYQSVKGKLFIYRESKKSGKPYKFYLKTE